LIPKHLLPIKAKPKLRESFRILDIFQIRDIGVV
jgi:hypothetical protein